MATALIYFVCIWHLMAFLLASGSDWFILGQCLLLSLLPRPERLLSECTQAQGHEHTWKILEPSPDGGLSVEERDSTGRRNENAWWRMLPGTC